MSDSVLNIFDYGQMNPLLDIAPKEFHSLENIGNSMVASIAQDASSFSKFSEKTSQIALTLELTEHINSKDKDRETPTGETESFSQPEEKYLIESDEGTLVIIPYLETEN